MTDILEVVDLVRRFAVGRHSALHAVDGVTFRIAPGESVGLVGESGCGKSTLVRLVTRMLDVTSGDVIFRGRNIGFIPARTFAGTPFRSRIQMVFQDPSDSLNPRFTAYEAIAEPLRRLGSIAAASGATPAPAPDVHATVVDAAVRCGLPEELLPRYPHQLSGGQKARVGIARAIALRPELLVLDEPTAALDVSVQATILKLLVELRRDLGMSYLFVSHDLNVVRMLCDRVIVMYLGKIVEEGPTAALFERPAHPYTEALIGSIPRIGGDPDSRVPLAGEPRSPIDPSPTACRFTGRCTREAARCTTEAPALHERSPGHHVACHFPTPAA